MANQWVWPVVVIVIVILAAVMILINPFSAKTVSDGTNQVDKNVCDSPYIRYGTSCCLDQNSNSICDSDENTESVNTDSGKYVSGTAQVGAPFGLVAHNVNTAGVQLELRNSGGDSYLIEEVDVSPCGVTRDLTNSPLSSGGSRTFRISCNLEEGSIFRGDITVTYHSSGSSLSLRSTGTISAKVLSS